MSTVIDDVKSRADVVDIVGRVVELKKAGSIYKGLCPFHQEKTPSFNVSPDHQNWRCWGCSRAGDVFDFIVEHEHVEFAEALRTLAQQVGVQIPEHGDVSERERKRKLYEIMERAAAAYQLVFWDIAASTPREYLRERGISDESMKSFGLGYAPSRGNMLIRELANRGVCTLDELYDAGLIARSPDGQSFDFFRDRIVIPIKDKHGRVIALGGRTLTPGSHTPKYINSPETPVFKKQDVLYCLDLAFPEMKRTKEVTIVEGYFDVITAHAHGYPNTVATMGTAITPSHLRQLKQHAETINVAMDSDTAGISATWRVLQTADQSLREGVAPILGPNRRHQNYVPGRPTHLKIVTLAGKDPDEVIRSNPKLWKVQLDGAQTVMDFVLTQLPSRYDLRSGVERGDAAADIAEVLAGVPNPVERAGYIQKAAEVLEVDESDIRELIVDRGVVRLDPPEKTSESDGDVEWDTYALALFRRCWGVTPVKLDDLTLGSSQGRAYITHRTEHPELIPPDELAEFQQRIEDRYDSLSLNSPASIRTLWSEATATLKRRAALRERAWLLVALRNAESDAERNRLAIALNEWRVE